MASAVHNEKAFHDTHTHVCGIQLSWKRIIRMSRSQSTRRWRHHSTIRDAHNMRAPLRTTCRFRARARISSCVLSSIGFTYVTCNAHYRSDSSGTMVGCLSGWKLVRCCWTRHLVRRRGLSDALSAELCTSTHGEPAQAAAETSRKAAGAYSTRPSSSAWTQASASWAR